MNIEYVIQKSRRKTISLYVSDEKKVIIKAPLNASTEYILDFVKEKKDWIIKQLERKSAEQEKLKALGLYSQADIRKIKKQAKKIIPERVEYYAALSGITYNRIFIRLQKSRWGSCSADGNLNFNCLLALMPVEVMDSVVVHELCHRRHMNHSREFYEEVYKYYPEYKKWHKWLKDNGDIYLRRAGL